MKLRLVVQRYGEEIVGGAERLCRGVAEGLAKRHDVEVLTTCALSYVTWANHYPEGVDELNGVQVRRFRTESERDIEAFNVLSEALFTGTRTPREELDWVEAQGPYAPALIDHVHAAASSQPVFVFFTYLYHPTVHGVHAAPDRSVLVPTAHDEAPFHLDTYRPVFELPAAMIYNTRAERHLVRQRFPDLDSPSTVIGAGIDDLERLEAAAGTADDSGPPTLLYAGRIDEGKGVGELLRYLSRYRDERGSELRLWLMGEVAMEIPDVDWIESLGFVPQDEKPARLAGAKVLLAPSAMESFGIVPLEAMAAGTPVLGNAASEALVEHCRAANAGLFYEGYAEFAEALDLLLQDGQLRAVLAANGGRYVREHYAWGRVVGRYERFLSQLFD